MTFTLIGRFYGTVLSSKRKLFSETLYLCNFLPHGHFYALYFDILTNKIEDKISTQTCQVVKLLRQ